MIPRVELPRGPTFGKERSAFARGAKERNLRVVVDRATAPDGEALEALLGFGDHPQLDLLSTRAEGLPHLDVGPVDQEADQAPVLISRPDGSTTQMAVWPASTFQALAERYLGEHRDLGDHDEVLRALLLASAAEDDGADALVTASRVLLDPAVRGRAAEDSNAMLVEQALALVGLYLRLRDDFTLGRVGGYRRGFNRGPFYWVLARELLPSAWRSTSAGGQQMQATGNDTVFQLFVSAITRLDRALRARDRLHGQTKLEQNNDTADEALWFLDALLVFLVGAFDAVGRAAHLTYGLDPSRLHRVGWRRPWRTQQLAPVAPALARLVDDGTPDRDALEVLALLRNTVHGEALRTVATGRASGSLQNVVLLPTDQEQALLAIVTRRGGDDAWGIRPLTSLGVSMQMDVFVEAVFPMAVAALNRLIGAIEVERLPGVQPADLPVGPPDGTRDDPFHPSRRRRARLLAGL